MLQKAIAYSKTGRAKKVFVSYCHADENIKALLVLALNQLQHEGRIASWHDRMLLAGQDWDKEINKNLITADMVLFLISPSFLNSSYCRDVEVKRALEREALRETFVIPIIAMQCDWKTEGFSRFLALPVDGQPLCDALGVPNARLLENVVDGIRLALLGLWNYADPSDIHGATIGASSRVNTDSMYFEPSASGILLTPTPAFTPTRLIAVKLRHQKPDALDFLADTGHGDPSNAQVEKSKLIEFFCEAAGTKDENIWVNLSPYETDRMLPKALAGTQIGRSLLETDCLLKEFSSSLLHPDSESGKEYWKEVYTRAKSAFGTTKLPFQSFQKVFILLERGDVYETTDKDDHSELVKINPIATWFGEENTTSAIVLDSHCRAVCETDLIALKHGQDAEAIQGQTQPETNVFHAVNDIAVQAFKDVILPLIERELNEGSCFTAARQIVNSLILATWFKKAALKIPSFAQRYGNYLNSDGRSALTPSLIGAQRIHAPEPGPSPYVSSTVDHLMPEDSAFRIPENREFYERYIRLFRKGLYLVARPEEGMPGEQLNRVYFSGGIDLKRIPATGLSSNFGLCRPRTLSGALSLTGAAPTGGTGHNRT